MFIRQFKRLHPCPCLSLPTSPAWWPRVDKKDPDTKPGASKESPILYCPHPTAMKIISHPIDPPHPAEGGYRRKQQMGHHKILQLLKDKADMSHELYKYGCPNLSFCLPSGKAWDPTPWARTLGLGSKEDQNQGVLSQSIHPDPVYLSGTFL